MGGSDAEVRHRWGCLDRSGVHWTAIVLLLLGGAGGWLWCPRPAAEDQAERLYARAYQRPDIAAASIREADEIVRKAQEASYAT
jgi:hypothetical protein